MRRGLRYEKAFQTITAAAGCDCTGHGGFVKDIQGVSESAPLPAQGAVVSAATAGIPSQTTGDSGAQMAI